MIINGTSGLSSLDLQRLSSTLCNFDKILPHLDKVSANRIVAGHDMVSVPFLGDQQSVYIACAMNSLEWSGGMEYWSGVLDWTTGVGGAA